MVNATVELPDTPLPDDRPNYLRVAIKDTKDANLLEYFDQVADLIEQVSFGQEININSLSPPPHYKFCLN